LGNETERGSLQANRAHERTEERNLYMDKSIRPAPTSLYRILMADYRKRLITEALERNGGSTTLAAKDLGIHRNMVTRAKAEIETPYLTGRKKGSSNLKQRQLIAAAESLYRLTRGIQQGKAA
jgi:DNA-binding NtrC family response regulator